MRICPKCGSQIADSAVYCTNCGAPYNGAGTLTTGSENQFYYDQNGTDYAMPYDHTGEFTQKDIHDNKVFCLSIYLMGVAGIIIAMIGSKESPYTAFHVRQALKLTIVEAVTGIITAVLFWTILIPIAGGVFLVILFVIRIICFVRICKGKAIEPPIVRGIGFLN